MTELGQIHNTVAPLRNVAALAALVDRVQNRPLNMPGMATFYGPSGYGKTFSAIYATNKFRAVCVQIKSTWTAKDMCRNFAAETGVSIKGNTTDIVNRISEYLAVHDVPLLIDEADYLVKRKMIEIIRDIHENSGTPVVLIGEELLPEKLKEWERVHGRMLDWVQAEPADLDDVRHLARLYVPGLEIADDVLARMLEASHGSIRRIRVNLARIEEQSRLKGARDITMTNISNVVFFTGNAPDPRDLRRAVK